MLEINCDKFITEFKITFISIVHGNRRAKIFIRLQLWGCTGTLHTEFPSLH